MGYTVQQIVTQGTPEPIIRSASSSPNGTDLYAICGFCAVSTGFNLYRNDAEPFRLYSIDLGGFGNVADEFDFTLTGYPVSGGTLVASQTVAVTQGIVMLTLDDSWRDLSSVTVLVDNSGNAGFSGSAYDNIVVARSVSIDVLPGDAANVVYPNRIGKVPVVVLGSPSFDATQVDPVTLRFGAAEASITGVPIIDDVDGQFGDDTQVRFKIEESGIFCNDPDVSLSAETYAGEAISGSDFIDATDCEAGSCHAY